MNIDQIQRQLPHGIITFNGVPQGFTVYFLTLNDEVVYIGKTSWKRLHRRMAEHARLKNFDSYHVLNINVEESACLQIEASMISLYRPEQNTKDCYPSFSKVVAGYELLQSISYPIAKQKPSRNVKTMFFLFAILRLTLLIGGLLGLAWCINSAFVFDMSAISYYSAVWWSIAFASFFFLVYFLRMERFVRNFRPMQ